MKNYEIDNLDKKILAQLLQEARTPYAKIAESLGVSAGTIHVRIEKMRQAGVIQGTKVKIEPKALGYDVCCFVGVFCLSIWLNGCCALFSCSSACRFG